MRKVAYLLILSIAVSLSTTGFSSASSGRGDWWMFQHDSQHTGQSAFDGPSKPHIGWRYYVGLNLGSSVVVAADGTAYMGAIFNALYAIRPNGEKKWGSFANNGGDIYSSPAIDSDGTIYISSTDGMLHAMRPDGTKKWSFATKGEVRASPVIAPDGTIYVGSYDHNLYAIHRDGKRKWVFRTRGNIMGSAALGFDGTIYVVSSEWYGDKLYAVNPDGKEKWNNPFSIEVFDGSMVTDATIHLNSVVPSIGTDGT